MQSLGLWWKKTRTISPLDDWKRQIVKIVLLDSGDKSMADSLLVKGRKPFVLMKDEQTHERATSSNPLK